MYYVCDVPTTASALCNRDKSGEKIVGGKRREFGPRRGIIKAAPKWHLHAFYLCGRFFACHPWGGTSNTTNDGLRGVGTRPPHKGRHFVGRDSVSPPDNGRQSADKQFFTASLPLFHPLSGGNYMIGTRRVIKGEGGGELWNGCGFLIYPHRAAIKSHISQCLCFFFSCAEELVYVRIFVKTSHKQVVLHIPA